MAVDEEKSCFDVVDVTTNNNNTTTTTAAEGMFNRTQEGKMEDIVVADEVSPASTCAGTTRCGGDGGVHTNNDNNNKNNKNNNSNHDNNNNNTGGDVVGNNNSNCDNNYSGVVAGANKRANEQNNEDDNSESDKKLKSFGVDEILEVRKQIEYYFSEENLKTDRFFQARMKECNGWLDFRHLLSSANLRKVNCSPSLIKEALTAHNTLLLHHDEVTNNSFVKTTNAIPILIIKPQTTNNYRSDCSATTDRRNGSSGSAGMKSSVGNNNNNRRTNNKDPHAAGCLAIVEGIPEDVSDWKLVKESIQAKLPQHEKCIRYAGSVNQDGTCFVFFNAFVNDKQTLHNLEVAIEGQTATIKLLESNDRRLGRLIGSLPPPIRARRDKEMSNPNLKLTLLPIFLGGQRFESFEHLRRCVEDLLAATDVGTTFEKTCVPHSVLKALMTYDPMRRDVIAGREDEFVGFRIGERPAFGKQRRGEEEGELKKVFLMIFKGDGEEVQEQTMHWKCITALSLNPPVEENTTTTTEGPKKPIEATVGEKLLSTSENVVVAGPVDMTPPTSDNRQAAVVVPTTTPAVGGKEDNNNNKSVDVVGDNNNNNICEKQQKLSNVVETTKPTTTTTTKEIKGDDVKITNEQKNE
eukprot:GHVS01076600.1.p1 GENE.GHVS01076600.1~~GHVS01076600.1.p1  ORF type:complete len:643 (+),score=207.94 GHVS01076600.1:25-1929(+)